MLVKIIIWENGYVDPKFLKRDIKIWENDYIDIKFSIRDIKIFFLL